jgi:6,7-dimethyl-8-ribityllumazine synthase
MATSLKNLSSYNPEHIPTAEKFRFGIVVAEWNFDITAALCKGAIETLLKFNVKEENIIVKYVPGTVELTYGAKMMAEKNQVDAVIALGCVIKGETPHFDFVCDSVTLGITELNLKYPLPFIFGVLTTNSLIQAQDRAGGKHGNKGVEAAITAIKMVNF